MFSPQGLRYDICSFSFLDDPGYTIEQKEELAAQVEGEDFGSSVLGRRKRSMFFTLSSVGIAAFRHT
jgi:hypothetical protein